MSSPRWIAAALASVILVGCENVVEPPAPQPTTFAFDVAVRGEVTQEFGGLTQVLTMRNGHAEPWPRPSGELISTDFTALGMIPGNQTVGLSIALFGPFGTGTFGLRNQDERLDPTARTFEATYSVQTRPGEFSHYKIRAGSVVVGMDGLRRTLSFSFSADSADLVRRGTFMGSAFLPVQLSGSMTEVPRN